jgi:hypothetical protein
MARECFASRERDKRGRTGLERREVHTGFVLARAQPDVIADCGSHAVPDSCPYAEVRPARATLQCWPRSVLSTAGQAVVCGCPMEGPQSTCARAQLVPTGCAGPTGLHVVRTGFVRAQPDAVTDWGSYAVADS